MAQAVAHDTSPLPKEGFLCPICLQDQGDANSLAAHFESAHNTAESADVIDQVKGKRSFMQIKLEIANANEVSPSENAIDGG